jgi:hypothetical protein
MDPRYPIGRFIPDATPTSETRVRHIAEIAALPQRFRKAVSGLSDSQLSTPYRDGGWTVRQLIHHVPDSHLNAYIRCKLALTEDSPTIKPYDQEAWANLADSALTPTEVSLSLLEAVHTRWVTLLRALTPDDFQRKFNHPETGVQSVDSMVALYAWHGNHHLGHITGLRERMKW